MTLHHELRAAAGNSSGSTDPYFNNVSLLLHGDGTNGAQNNTFLGVASFGSAAIVTTSPITQLNGWYTRSMGPETSPTSNVRETIVRANGVTIYSATGSSPPQSFVVDGVTYTPGTYVGSAYGWGGDYGNSFNVNASPGMNVTITRNGNTTQGSLSPYGTAWSNYFDGSGDALTLPSNSALAPGSGNFTVEAWLYNQNGANLYPYIFSNSGVIIAFMFGDGIGDAYKAVLSDDYYPTSGNAPLLTGTSTISQNTWAHVAWVRYGSTITVYINGTASGSVTSSTNHNREMQVVGAVATAGSPTAYFWNGYISNLRIVKGTALYTSNFTPPTTPLTAISGTSLLTCQSNRFKDNSSNNFTLTPYGNVAVQSFSPYLPTAAYDPAVNGGSGYFDGSGDYLSVADNTALQWGTGDFTTEFWLLPNNVSGNKSILCKGTNNSGTFELGLYGTKIELYTNVLVFSSSANIATNTWTHVALSRSSSTLRLFINGVLDTTVSSYTYNFNNTATFYVGVFGSATQNYYAGYLSNVRCVKGTAVYTSNFTPPTAPLTAISGTSLLCNFTNAGIYDNAAKNDLETVGNAQISTSVKKYGTGSMYFDGTGDYLAKSIADPQTIFGTGDFTFECWVYPTTLNSYNMILGYASPNQYWSVRNTGYLHFYDGSTAYEASTNAVPLNQWTHIAISRYGSTLRQFVNGVQATSSTCATSIGAASALWFGASAAYPSQHFFNGYIDDLRITKGVARYTANFTPPTQAFPNQ